MEAAGGSQEHGQSHGETVQVAGGAPHAVASDNGVVTVSPRTGETREGGFSGASADAVHSPAQQLIEKLRRSQEEIPGMGKAELLAFEEHLRALRLRVLQQIKEQEEKAAAAEQAPVPELRTP